METMSFGQAIKTCFKKYCVFKGRARRSEYWYWTLFVILLSVGIEVLQGLLSLPALFGKGSVGTLTTFVNVFSGVISAATILPSLGVTVRRLHDTNHSGWWLLALYVLEIAFLVLILGGMDSSIITGDVPDLDFSSMNTTQIALLCLVGVFGIVLTIVMFIWYCTDSKPGNNKYGPSPKEPSSDQVIDPSSNQVGEDESEQVIESSKDEVIE